MEQRGATGDTDILFNEKQKLKREGFIEGVTQMENDAVEFQRFVVQCEYSYKDDVYEIQSNPHGIENGMYTTEQLYQLFKSKQP
jgi:hypothetical protein